MNAPIPMADSGIIDVQQMLAGWDRGDGKPMKGSLIDRAAYAADPTNIGCMCAQGQVLHLIGGWSPERLSSVAQSEADKETAKLLKISIAHAVLLRVINDKADGAPSIVLTHPEKVLGDQAHIVLAFWRHLDRMSGNDWRKVAAAWVAARVAAGAAAWVAAGAAAGAAARDAAGAAAGAAVRVAAEDAIWNDARDAAWVAGYACNEIQGASLMRERGQPFFFLPMFGFADPEAVLAADRVSA